MDSIHLPCHRTQCSKSMRNNPKRKRRENKKKNSEEEEKRRKIIPCPAIRNSHPPLPHLIQFPIPQPTKMLLPPELAGKQQRRSRGRAEPKAHFIRGPHVRRLSFEFREGKKPRNFRIMALLFASLQIPCNCSNSAENIESDLTGLGAEKLYKTVSIYNPTATNLCELSTQSSFRH